MLLDDETLSLLSGRHEDALFDMDMRLAAYLERRQERRLAAKAAYEQSEKGKRKRAEYNGKFRKRAKRQTRAACAANAGRSRSKPVLKGYARIKAWREKNPKKHAANERRYLQSEKGKAMKSKKNKKWYAKNREREIARNRAVRAAKKAKQS